MQLLHIADLHFGRLLYGRSLMDDQRHFVRQSLLPALDEYKPMRCSLRAICTTGRLPRSTRFIYSTSSSMRCANGTSPPSSFPATTTARTALRWAKACLRGTASISSRSLKTRLRRSRSATYRFSRCRTLKTPRCAKCWAMKRCAVRGLHARGGRKNGKAFDPRKARFGRALALRRGPPPPIPKAAFLSAARAMCRRIFSR